MPLAKGSRGGKGNQGAQWGDTGPAGNIKNLPEAGGTDKTKRDRVVNRSGRNRSLGKASSGRRASRGN